MEVILVEKIEKLGDVGSVVKVKNGYGRNYLLPKKKALRATKENREYFEQQKEQILARNSNLTDEAEKIFSKINNKSIAIIRHASDEGRLYGSVMPKDISDKLSEAFSVVIQKSQVLLAGHIRMLGVFDAKIRIHADFVALVKVSVARSEDEAKENLKKILSKEEEKKEASQVEAKKEKKKSKEQEIPTQE